MYILIALKKGLAKTEKWIYKGLENGSCTHGLRNTQRGVPRDFGGVTILKRKEGCKRRWVEKGGRVDEKGRT